MDGLERGMLDVVPKIGAISGFGWIDGPSIPPLRQYFWPLGFHTALFWSGQVSGFVIRYYSNIITEFDTLLRGLH